MRLHRLLPATAMAVALALTSSACEFDGAYDLPLPRSIDTDHAYTVTAEFTDVLSVVPRSIVMVDDLPVGEVAEVERVGWHAEVTLWVRDDVVLPDNVTAEIRQTSLLGEKYVALLEPATARGRLGDGDHIPLSATGRNPEVEEVLGALSFLLSGGGVGQLAVITRELNAVMDGREQRLRSLLDNLEGVVGTVDDQKGDIIRAMGSLNNLARTLNAGNKTIDQALEVMGPAVAVLSRQHDELVAMLRALDRLGAVGTRVITATREDLLATLGHLRPVLRKLNETGDSLAPGVSLMLSFPFPVNANDIVHGDYANTIIRMDLSLDNFGGGGDGDDPLPDLPGLPDLPLPDVPDLPLPDLPDLPLPDLPGLPLALKTCVESDSLLSQPCEPLLEDSRTFSVLMDACGEKAWSGTAICRGLAGLPSDGSGVDDDPLVLPGLGTALFGGAAWPGGTELGLYGGDL